MSYDEELNWLRDRGVQIDRKGRIIVSLPAIPDDVNFDLAEREPSIAELMRHEINPHLAGSRGRRRRHLSTPVQRNPGATRFHRQLVAARVGRPTIGSEVRVHVQTMIAQETRDILVKHRVTLADVFDDCAQRLLHVSSNDDEAVDAEKRRPPAGRPKSGRPKRVRITTTIEPSKLAVLREHARREKKSLGQLADEYVAEQFPSADAPSK